MLEMRSISAGTRRNSSRACETCRTLKVKCIADGETRVCQKCSRAGVSCIWREQRPRPRNPKPRPQTRISALEDKLNRLIAEVTELNQPMASSPDDSGVYPSPGSSNSPVPKCSLSIDRRQDSPDPTGLQEVISQFQISDDDAEQYLGQYREMSLYFPFAILPSNSTLRTLSKDRPFFLLAVLSAASSSNKLLQTALEKTLRSSVLDKIMLCGEKSLDLLSALIVYMAWYHFFYVPKLETLSQLLHIAISMCFDLGLHITPAEAVGRKAGLRLDHYRKLNNSDDEHDPFFSREARRLFMGCYYLSSSFSWLKGTPCTFPYTEYMQSCGKALALEKEFPTDEAILSLIQLAHMAEVHHELMLDARTATHSTSRLARIHAQLRSADAQLQTLRNSISGILNQSTFVELAFHSTAMYIHEMNIINPFVYNKSNDLSESQDQIAGPTITTSTRVEVLLRCLEGANHFFQTFLTIPAPAYHHLSSIQWISLINATIIAYKLSIGIPNVPEWDVQIARSTVSIEDYLETCCRRMEEASGIAGTEVPARRSLFDLMSPIWRNVKETYEALKQLPQHQSTTDLRPVHTLSFSAASDDPDQTPPESSEQQIRPTLGTAHRCPAFPFWKRYKDGGIHGAEGSSNIGT